jgi:ArsR family transcriptional regulator
MSTRSDVGRRGPDLCDIIHLHPARVAELRAALIGADDVTDLAETFRTLGDPTRVRILDALSHGELCVCDLAALVGMTESAVSHQLRLLRNLRLVRPRRDGRMVFYALDDRHIMSLFRQGLRHVQEAVASRRPRRRAR